MRNLLVFLFAGFLFQSAMADPAYYFGPQEIELYAAGLHVVVRTGEPGFTGEPGLVAVESATNPNLSQTAELPDEFKVLRNVQVVRDKLWIHGTWLEGLDSMMAIYRLEPLELIDWVICHYNQTLSPSGRFAVYEKGRGFTRGERSDGVIPVTLLYDLWAEPDRNRVAGNKVFEGDPYVVSDAGLPIHPPDAAAKQVYHLPTNGKTRGQNGESIGKRLTIPMFYTWSGDESLLAFVLGQYRESDDLSLERRRRDLVVMELDADGRPLKYHETGIPDRLHGIDKVKMLGSSIRLVSEDRYGREQVTWIPNPQPWQR